MESAKFTQIKSSNGFGSFITLIQKSYKLSEVKPKSLLDQSEIFSLKFHHKLFPELF